MEQDILYRHQCPICYTYFYKMRRFPCCRQFICSDCVKKLPKKECPFCRNPNFKPEGELIIPFSDAEENIPDIQEILEEYSIKIEDYTSIASKGNICELYVND